MRKEQLDEHPELAQFYERMTFLPLEHITALIPPGGERIGMHVIPVEKAIEMENNRYISNIFLIGLKNMMVNYH